MPKQTPKTDPVLTWITARREKIGKPARPIYLPKETDAQAIERLRNELAATLEPVLNELLGPRGQPAVIEALTGMTGFAARKALYGKVPRPADTEVILKLLLSIVDGIRDRADELEGDILRCMEIFADPRVMMWRRFKAAHRPLIKEPKRAKKQKPRIIGLPRDHRGVVPLRRTTMELIEEAEPMDGYGGGPDPEIEALLKQAGIADQ